MKKFICAFLFPFAVTVLSANEIIISFQSKVLGVVIDSIHASNLTRGQPVKLDSGESLIIAPATYNDLISNDDPGKGYLYPNPTDGFTTLSFKTVQEEEVLISVYNMGGKMIMNTIRIMLLSAKP